MSDEPKRIDLFKVRLPIPAWALRSVISATIDDAKDDGWHRDDIHVSATEDHLAIYAEVSDE